MSLLFCDSFDHYATADITTKWTSQITGGAAGSNTITANGQRSTSALRMTWGAGTSTGPEVQRSTGASGATAVIGVALKVSALPTAAVSFLSVYDGSTVQSCLRLNVDGTISVIRGTQAGTVLGTTVQSISSAVWAYIEYKTVINNATGTYEVRVNGTSWLSGSGANTRNSAANQWTIAALGKNASATGAGNSFTFDFDDLYACDGSGSVNNDFLGPILVQALLPSGAGTTTNMTPSTGSNFQNVDDATPNGDTDYNSETTLAEFDTYAFGNTSFTGTVKGIQHCIQARSAASGGETIAPMTRISTTNYTGTTSAGLSTSYAYVLQVKETSPATATAWTTSEIDGAEFGVKLVS